MSLGSYRFSNLVASFFFAPTFVGWNHHTTRLHIVNVCYSDCMNTDEMRKQLKTYPARIAYKRNTALRRLAEHDKLMEEAKRMEADYEKLKRQAQ